jgi:hypothetical protein
MYIGSSKYSTENYISMRERLPAHLTGSNEHKASDQEIKVPSNKRTIAGRSGSGYGGSVIKPL